ncbi:MAG: alpha/beta fold hydrolase [Kosmotogaceae bacterium]|nr:alpha/beta fold hydrolase [Kosmotogaceae bacterium]
MRIFFTVVMLAASAICLTYEGQVLFSGNEIHYEVEEADGELVILIGDGPGFSSSYMKGILSGRKTLRYDQLESGSSKNHSHIVVDFQYFVAELASLIFSLEIDSFHLLGHGFGSAIALGFALTNPEGLLSLVMVNPRLNFPAIDFALSDLADDESFHSFDKFHYLFGDGPVSEVKPVFSRDNMNEKIYNLFWGESPTSISGILRGQDFSSGLIDIDVPILVCSGLHSFPGIKNTLTFQEGSPNMEFVTFMNSGHLPMFEEQKAFKSIVQDFLLRAEENLSHQRPEEMSLDCISEVPGDMVFGWEDLERVHELHVGDDFTVKLPSNRGAGYFWKVKSFDENFIRPISDPYYEELKESGGGRDVFTFRVVGSGKTSIEFSFGSLWEETSIRTSSLFIHVEKPDIDPIIIDSSDSGKTLLVGLNEPIEVVLESPIDSGLRWRISATTPEVLRQPRENDVKITEPSTYSAGKIEQTYYFEGMNYGQARLKFDYGSLWEDVAPERSFEATIVVAEPVREYILIQDSDNGSTISVGVDQTVLVRLKKGNEEDCRWQLPSQSSVESVGDISEVEYMGVRYSVFRFKPINAGDSTLEFLYFEDETRKEPIDIFKIDLAITEESGQKNAEGSKTDDHASGK